MINNNTKSLNIVIGWKKITAVIHKDIGYNISGYTFQ